MKIASAQINSTLGDVDANIKKHIEIAELASNYQADLVLFPEMSITSYCRKEGSNFSLTMSSTSLEPLKQAAVKYNLIIVAGAPISINSELFIGSFIFHPDKRMEIYTKQYLHEGEDLFYSSSFDYNPQVEISKELISWAVCADINHELHPSRAKQNGSSIYLASIFFTEEGIEKGHEVLSNYAIKYDVDILMSNYCGINWTLKSGGKSAFWAKKGSFEMALNENQEGLLLIEKINDEYKSEICYLNK